MPMNEVRHCHHHHNLRFVNDPSPMTPLHRLAPPSRVRAARLSLPHLRVASSAVCSRSKSSMFCYQCEQTTHGKGCITVGVCGKTAETATLQDLLVHRLKGLAGWVVHAKDSLQIDSPSTASFFRSAMFATMTNVNFDSERFVEYIRRADQLSAEVRSSVLQAGGEPLDAPSVPWFQPEDHPFALNTTAEYSIAALREAGGSVGVEARTALANDPTLVGLHELVTYGIKGAAAYAHHAAIAGVDDQAATDDLMRAMACLCTPTAGGAGEVLSQALKVGEANLRIMGSLESAHTSAYGTPSPYEVRMGPVKGKALLVTGHDLTDLHRVLEMTSGAGVNVYTHGEMLPAHSYPELRKYDHLAGHYGGAWYRQKIDFAAFPGSILVTTNCVLDPPKGSYANRMFTTGETGVVGVRHLENSDFTPLVSSALEQRGFTAEDEKRADGTRKHLVGFGRETTLGAAPAVLDAIKEGKLNHIFLIGGCDGSEGSRRYYARLSKMLPQTSMILTLGCAKYRLLDQDFGKLPGTDLPRLLDMGQCNDSYAAIQVAVALAQATGSASVNDLPLSLDISWFEQKAVAVLLSLLHLGVTDIRLGPALPGFVTPEALQILVEKFNIKPADLNHPEEDLAKMLQHGHQ